MTFGWNLVNQNLESMCKCFLVKSYLLTSALLSILSIFQNKKYTLLSHIVIKSILLDKIRGEVK